MIRNFVNYTNEYADNNSNKNKNNNIIEEMEEIIKENEEISDLSSSEDEVVN